MELHTDPEYRSLIPPLSNEEYEALKESLLKNGFDPAYPIIIWNDTIVDGHNRYELCQKHGISFKTIEKQFKTRNEAIIWIIDNQLARRNITSLWRTYLIGKRYKEEKKRIGAPDCNTNASTSEKKQLGHSDPIVFNSTAAKIAEQEKVSEKTVKRAGKLTEALDLIAENTGTDIHKIFTEDINATCKDIQIISQAAPEKQKEILAKVESREAKNIRQAARLVLKEETARNKIEQPPNGKYRAIVIDPPWEMAKIIREERPDQGLALDYPVMSIEKNRFGSMP